MPLFKNALPAGLLALGLCAVPAPVFAQDHAAINETTLDAAAPAPAGTLPAGKPPLTAAEELSGPAARELPKPAATVKTKPPATESKPRVKEESREQVKQEEPPPPPLTEEEKAKAALLAAIVRGPASVALGTQATLALPDGYAFIPKKPALQVMDRMGNHVPRKSFLGMIVPVEDDPDWFIGVEFSDTGFRKDDDADQIDADEILKDMQEGAKEGNPDRAAHGVPQLEVVGWVEKPHYNKEKHQFVWSVEARDIDNKPGDKNTDTTVNYNTFTLGRAGDLSLNLVCHRSEVESHKKAVAEMLAGLKFNDGKRYEDFDAKTDKVAAYGLMGLIGLGIAKQAGLFGLLALGTAKIVKLALVAAAGAAAAFRKFFRRRDSTV